MTPKKKKETGESTAPLQSEEAREKVIGSSTAGKGTAVGQAREHFLGNETERIENLESRGSTVEIAGGDPEPDAVNPGQPPKGAQAQPSAFVSNGSIPVNMVPSGSGLVPVSSVTSDPEHATELVQRHQEEEDQFVLRTGAKKLSRNQIEGMTGADLRAVAQDRGYDLPEGGTRTTRRNFIKAQNADEGLPNTEGEGEAGAGEREPGDDT